MKTRISLLALLLFIALSVFFFTRKSSHDIAPSDTGKAVTKVAEREVSDSSDDLVESPGEMPVAGAPVEEDAAVSAKAVEKKPFIIRVISSEWADPEEKAAGRRRVRIVEADFKYPRLRLEEAVLIDADTGEETVTVLRASVADHVMVGLAPETDAAAASQALEQSGYVIRSVEPGSFLLVELPEYEAAAAQPDAIREISALNKFISFAEPDYIVYPSLSANDPDYLSGKLWGLHNRGTEAGTVADADIDAPEAWELRTNAPGVIVAVTDTGIQYNHEDLSDNMWEHPTTGEHGLDAYDDDSDPMDMDGHGTHCAGTIGARGNNSNGMTGVAWNVKLMAGRFLGPNGGSTSDGIRVINYARENGADIISASWGGGGYSQSLYNAIDACRLADIPFVAAAGNDGVNNDSTPHYPSSYTLSNIVSVAATTSADKLSYFSCYGRNSVDIGAPGSNIWSTYIGSNQSYKYLNGTSMATPHVSGALALAKAHFPSESSSSLIARLYASVNPIPALYAKVSSGGRLNLDRLLQGVSPNGNDDFADAYRFEGGYGVWSGSNENATREAGEDNFSLPGLGQKSMWFAFNSEQGGLATLKSRAEYSDYQMLLLEGSTKATVKIVENTGLIRGPLIRGPLDGTIFYNTKPNTEYRVVIDTVLPQRQDFTLTYTQEPENDMFSSATVIPPGDFTVLGTVRGATEELFERYSPHVGKGRGQTVWWRWKAAQDGDFTINTSGSDFDTFLSVYTGPRAGELSNVAWNDDRSGLDHTSQVTFAATEGTTYHIAVDGYREDATGDVVLNGLESGYLEIVRQPLNVQVEVGRRAEFSVSVNSDGPPTYQWFQGGNAMAGKTSPKLTIDPVKSSDFGDYSVQIDNGINTVLSEVATLSETLSPPAITWQSSDPSVYVGDNVTLGILTIGSDPITYSWKKDGVALPGLTTARIDLGMADSDFAGIYKCTATNSVGSATAAIQVRVIQSPFESFSWSRVSVPSGAITDLKVIDGKCYGVSGDRVLVSENGDEWVEWKLPPGFDGALIEKLGSNWICIGFRLDGKQAVAVSSDGITWAAPVAVIGFESQNGSQGMPMLQLESFAGKLVGIYPTLTSGDTNRVMHSTDGITWTKAQAGPSGGPLATFFTRCRMFEWGGKLFLPAGQSVGNARLLTSVDGAVWTETAMPLNPSGEVTGAGEFVSSCSGILYYVSEWGTFSSSGGVAWTFLERKRSLDLARYLRFAETGDGCFAFAKNSQRFYFASSTSGWGNDIGLVTKTLLPAGSQNFTCATDFDGSVIFGTQNGLLRRVTNPADVTLPKTPALSLEAIHHVNGEFLAYRPSTASGQRPVLISGDGKTWRQGRSFQETTESVNPPGAFIAGRYLGGALAINTPVAAGWAPSAISTKSVPQEMNKAVSSAAFDGTRWLVLSPSQIQSVSADGATWTTVAASGYTPSVGDKILRFDGRWFVNSRSYDNGVYSSADGASWSKVPSLALRHMTVFDNKLCGVSADGATTYVSIDGITWTPFPVNHGIGSTGIGAVSLDAIRLEEFNGSLVLLLKGRSDSRGFLFFSNDGEYWINVALPTGIRDFTSANGTFCLTTDNGGFMSTRDSDVEDFTAPIVSITSPVHKSVHVKGTPVSVSGMAINPDGGMVTTDCFVDGVLVGTSTSPEFHFTFRPSDSAGHVVTVRSRGSGDLVGSDEILVSVTSPQLENRLETGNGGGYSPIIAWTSFGNRVYAVDAYSLRRSRGDGTWENMNLPTLPAAITNIVSGNGTLIVQTSKGALVTRDGINWSRVDGLVSGFTGTRGNIVFRDGWFSAITGSNPTYSTYSRDGLNWSLGAAFPVSTVPTAPVVVSENILLTSPPYRSTDGGVNWTAIPELTVANSHLTSLVMAFGKVFAALPDGRLFTSTDAGATWQLSHSFGALSSGHAPRIAIQQGRLFWGTGGYWLASSENGTAWESLSGKAVLSSRIESLNGLMVAPGFAGMVWSADGLSWKASPTDFRNPVRDLIGHDGDSLLQADSAGGLWQSVDGMAWVRILAGRLPEPPEVAVDVSKLSSIKIGGHTVYGIPYYGLCYSSSNGLKWNQGTFNGGPLPGDPQQGKLWTDGETAFAGVSRNAPVDGADANELWISADGADWSQIASWKFGAVADMAESGGTWMALGTNGNVRVSTNEGATWSEDKVPVLESGRILKRFAGRWIAMGTEQANGQGAIIVYSSANGQSWVRDGQVTTDSAGSLISVKATDQALVAVFSFGRIYTATDSTLSFELTATTSSINAQSAPKLDAVGGLLYLENRLVSSDGVTWQVPVPVGSSILTPSYRIAGKYISFPYYQMPYWSDDGLNWVQMTGVDTSLSYSPMVSQGIGYLRARDSKGGIWETVDGMSWSQIADGSAVAASSAIPRKIIEFGSRLIVGGTSGLMLSSADDGATWEPAILNGQPFPSGMEIRKLIANDSEALAFHTVNGNTFPPVLRYFRTTDGVNWTENTQLPALKLMNAVYSGGVWTGIRGNGELVESTDGALTWQSIGSIPGIVYGYEISRFNGRWIAACSSSASGTNLTVYTSPDRATWTSRHATTYSTSSGSEFFTAHGKLYFGNGPTSQQSSDGFVWAAFDKPSSPATLSGHRVKTMIPVDGEFLGFESSGNNSYFWTAPATAGAWQIIDPYQNQIKSIGTPDSSRVFLFGTGIIKELVRNDLAISFSDPAAADYGVGDEISLDVKLQNLGSTLPEGLDSLLFEAWLSSDGFVGDGNDIFIGKVTVPVDLPAPGGEISIVAPFILPNEISSGTQRVILKLTTEGLLAESNRANNVYISSSSTINIPEWEFNLATNGNGSVNRDFAATRYPHKSRVSLTASAGKGAVFSGWAGDALSPNNQITLLMDGDKSVQANFATRTNLQLFVRGMGEVTGFADLGSYASNTTADLTAVPAAGWSFSHWSGASADATVATSVLMDSSKTLTAHFVFSLADWKASVFDAAQLADLSVSGDNADPDGDGVENWQEHLHGSRPLDATSSGAVSLTIDGEFLRCVYTRLSSPASGTPVQCQAGRAMNDWDSTELEERVISSDNGIETIEARLPHGETPRGFIRFRYVPEVSAD